MSAPWTTQKQQLLFIQVQIRLKLYPAFPTCFCSCITDEAWKLKKTRPKPKQQHCPHAGSLREQQHSKRLSSILTDPQPKEGSTVLHHIYPILNNFFHLRSWRDKASRYHHHPQPHTAWDGLRIIVVLDAWTEAGWKKQCRDPKRS